MTNARRPPPMPNEVVISFSWILSYLRKARIRLSIAAILGLIVGLILYFLTPKMYEANFIIKMPSANAISSLGEIEKHIIKPVPTALDTKKLLLKPENFSKETLKSCGLNDTNGERKQLVGYITSHIVNYESSLQIVVRLPGDEIVRNCANAILRNITQFANFQKDQYVQYAQLASSNASLMLVNENAFITSPIRVSDKIVSPRFWHLIAGCILIGLILMCLIDWLRIQFKEASLRS